MTDHILQIDKNHHAADLETKAAQAEEASDRDIWIGFLQGDDHAVASLYKLYANRLFNYGCQFTRDKDLVADAIQDVFLGLIRSRSKLGVASSVKFYLYSSLRRSLLRQLKRSSKFVHHDDLSNERFQLVLNRQYLAISAGYTNEQKKIIEHFCNKLPQRQREALVLYYFEDLNYAEIAKTMSLSNSKSARTVVYRALDSLSKLLSSWKKELTVLGFLLSSLS